MKKYLLAAALVMASTSAMADRTVTATGLESPSGSKISACDDAKRNARNMTSQNEQVESYSACECGKNKHDQWTCSVDAKVEKKE